MCKGPGAKGRREEGSFEELKWRLVWLEPKCGVLSVSGGAEEAGRG